MSKSEGTIRDFITFLDRSPTAWHAVAEIERKLEKTGFHKLDERMAWHLQGGKKYFVIRNDSSLLAFILPSKKPTRALVVGTHTDSPGFRIKPHAEVRKDNMVMLGAEIYGAPLLTSWLNRDLGVAGRVITADRHGKIQTRLVTCASHPMVIPQLAIHLDRDVNDKGLLLDKQEHLMVLAALDTRLGRGSYLEMLLKEHLSREKLLASELFLYPLDGARRVGHDGEMISSYRLDNLGSAHAALEALCTAHSSNPTLKIAAFWDHEEIGSLTAQGAASPFFTDVLERICLSYKMEREEEIRLRIGSLCLSVDLAHAYHPSFPDRHDSQHKALMDRGIVLKENALQRYISDATTTAALMVLAKKAKVSLQRYVNHNAQRGGATFGPIHAAGTGMPTIDIGYPQLSMHSAREIASCRDHLSMIQFLKQVYKE